MTARLVRTEELSRALELLEGGKHLFLTGRAGTGKSTLIRQFLATTKRRVVVAAPTGIAALNVTGYTIHRLLSLTATTTVEDVRSGRYRPGRFAKTLTGLDTLIIDEASMVRADLFDMLTAALERFGPRPGSQFGGVQLVLVGDLHQLPPVVTDREADYFSTRYASPFFFSADSYRGELFPTVELTTVFRQAGDDRLTAILNALREGALLGHAMAELNERTDPEFQPPAGELWLTLTPTNRLATSRNRQRLEQLDTPEHLSTATRTGDLSTLDEPADATLHLKVGAQVMMLTNDPADRWVNGTLGRIEHIDPGRGAGELSVVVTFTDGSAAEVGRNVWEATRPVLDGGALRHEVVGTFTQLPLRLAWAVTIHKSQGQTLDRVLVDLTGGTFSAGQVYVALSRCTSMAGLVLRRPVLAKDLKSDRRITRFLASARPSTAQGRFCAIAALVVGEEGRRSRPRPVELAVALPDGTALSTLVNPQRDLADARARHQITTADVALAPTLAEAWAVLAPVLQGYTPVGANIDETIALIDFELKRLGAVVPLPLGVLVTVPARPGRSAPAPSVPPALSVPPAPSALDLAREALTAFETDGAATDAVDAFTDPAETDLPAGGLGYLLTRDAGFPAPQPAHLPGLADLLAVSGPISAALLGGPVPAMADLSGPTVQLARAQVLTAAGRVPASTAVLDRLSGLETLLGSGLTDQLAAQAPEIVGAAEALYPGARVCFTGEVLTPSGGALSRTQMEELARAGGLHPVPSMTKTRTDVLVTAETGTQSGKARKAREYGKPVLDAGQFFD
ncbi:AAA family ATPase [Ruania zhangjianzhongii]|nr:AAA family ATPase [Ruania zhangjianzhongii]